MLSFLIRVAGLGLCLAAVARTSVSGASSVLVPVQDAGSKNSQDNEFEKLLEKAGSRKPGESVEQWLLRTREAAWSEINEARAEWDGFQEVSLAFVNKVGLGGRDFSRWLPSIEDAGSVCLEVGLPDTPSCRKFVLGALSKHIQSSQFADRITKLIPEDFRVHGDVAALFLVDKEHRYSVIVWKRSAQGWTLTGLAGMERAFLLNTVDEVRKSSLRMEEDARKYIGTILIAPETSTHFGSAATELKAAWLKAAAQGSFKGASSSSVRILEKGAEVLVETSYGQLFVGLEEELGTLSVNYCYGDACSRLLLPSLPWATVGDSRLRQGDIIGAKSAYQLLISHDSNSVLGYRGLTLTYLAEKNFDLALGAALQVRDLAKESSDGYLLLSHVFLAKGEAKEALAILQEAQTKGIKLEIQPWIAGLALVESGHSAAAVTHLMSVSSESTSIADIQLLARCADAAGLETFSYVAYARLRKLGVSTTLIQSRLKDLSKKREWGPNEDIDLRREPDFSSPVVGRLLKGNRAIKLLESDRWVQLVTRDDRLLGWAQK